MGEPKTAVGIDPTDRCIVKALRGELEPDAWSAELFERAGWHRVDALLAAALVRHGGLPEPTVAGLRAMLRERAAADLALTAAIERLTTAIAADQCHAILLKGAALAALVYPASHLRPRLDTDILIRPGDRRHVEDILIREGFAATPEALGALGTGQSHWIGANAVAVDLHWRLFNAQAFGEVLSFDELWRESRPAHIAGARVPSLEHQLLIAAVHRVAHHFDSSRLIWLYDLHLLVSALGPGGLGPVAAAAERRGVGGAVARGVLRATELFGPALPAEVVSRFSALVPERHQRAYVEGAPRLIDLLASDLAAQPGWRSRGRLLREHLVPPAAYMRTRYPGWPRFFLPIAYVDRIVRGVPRWFSRAAGRP